MLDTRNYTWTLYASRVGLGRLLEICGRHACRATIVANGLAIERSPALIRQAAEAGHEIAAHGYEQGEPLYLMDRDARERDISTCQRIIAETTGKPPHGWVSPGLGYTEDTLELLARMGFLWHGDRADADLPYRIEVSGRPLVEIPVNLDLNDNATYVRHGLSPATHLEKIRCVLETFSRERATRPALLSPVFHCHNSGRPMGAWAFEETLRLVRGHPGVWFATYEEIARICLG
ncbi:MAG: polysaccharide deacetylase family protein [Deltaproteobacteria bacterium]|nr:polysaccharide deacetylase family protein [Deltaproteobacteria bacterium]